MDYSKKARAIIDLEISALADLKKRLGTSFIQAIEHLLNCLQTGHKLIATGIGKSGHIAEKIAATLTSTGAPCVYLNCVNAIHGDLGIISEGDTLLVFSYSGETQEILQALPALTRPRIQIIAITGNAKSTLARNAHVHLDVKVKREACPLNLAPTSSTTAMLALGDALAMVLLEARGFKKEDFAKFHPGGTIGKNLLLQVADVMRSRDQIALVSETATVMQALAAITKARVGAAVVVTPQDKLAGIFTQGDFARHYQTDANIGQEKVKKVMTRHPLSVNSDKLAVEALKIFEKHSIDDLVVIDHKGKPVGLVDAQDLAKYKLI